MFGLENIKLNSCAYEIESDEESCCELDLELTYEEKLQLAEITNEEKR